MLKRGLSPLVSSSGTRLLQCSSKTARSYQLLKIRHFGISDTLMGMATKKIESGKGNPCRRNHHERYINDE
jgi:hypothetical protein